MEFLIQDLLDYAQIKAGKFRKNIKKFNLRDAIEKIMCIQRKKAEENGIKFSVIYENIAQDDSVGQIENEDYSPIINSDEKRIQQILLNLQSNALKFTKKGGVTIRAKITSEKPKSMNAINSDMNIQDLQVEDVFQRYLSISVEDTGVGIKKEDQKKLFKQFGYLDKTNKMNTQGIGLGLLIS